MYWTVSHTMILHAHILQGLSCTGDNQKNSSLFYLDKMTDIHTQITDLALTKDEYTKICNYFAENPLVKKVAAVLSGLSKEIKKEYILSLLQQKQGMYSVLRKKSQLMKQ